jgi:hypothetical protein
MKSMLGFRRLVVLHSKTLKSLSNVTICSTYSTKPPEMTSKLTKETVGDDVNEERHKIKTNNREINLFGPKDIRAPLNGDIGLGFTLNDQNLTQFYEIKPKIESIDLNSLEDKSLKQYSVIKQFFSPNLDKESETNLLKSMSSPILQCIAHECPILLIRDFQDLFPISSSKSPDLLKGLTVITLCQKTVNDMSAWTPQVDHEREELMGHFVSVAKNICDYLTNKGFWADFIDPSSGRPFLVCFNISYICINLKIN